MSKLETNTIDTVSGTTNLVIGSTNSSTVTFENGAVTGHNYPAFLVTLSSNQTIASGSSVKIQLDSEVYDTDNAFDNSTNYRFTVPSGKAGKYVFHLSGRTDIANATISYIFVKKNDTLIARSFQSVAKSNGSTSVYLNASVVTNLVAGDYIELFIFQNSGSNQLAYADYCSLAGYRIGA